MRQGVLTLAALEGECGDAEFLNTEIGETAVGGCPLGGGERIPRAFRKPLCRGDGARRASVAAGVVDLLPLRVVAEGQAGPQPGGEVRSLRRTGDATAGAACAP